MERKTYSRPLTGQPVDLAAPADMPLIERIIQALLDFERRRRGLDAVSGPVAVHQLSPDMRRDFEEHARRLLVYVRNPPPVIEIDEVDKGGRPWTKDVRATALLVPHVWHAHRFHEEELRGLSSEWVASDFGKAIAARVFDQVAEPLAQALEASGFFNPRGR